MIYLKRLLVSINNIVVFLSVVIPLCIPLYKWPYAWRRAGQAHQRELNRNLTELTMSGKIKRRIVDGEFIYYPMEDENERE